MSIGLAAREQLVTVCAKDLRVPHWYGLNAGFAGSTTFHSTLKVFITFSVSMSKRARGAVTTRDIELEINKLQNLLKKKGKQPGVSNLTRYQEQYYTCHEVPYC